MAVFRIEKTRDFTVMSNYHLRDVELSLKAKGLLSLMLSLPEDWDYTTKGLACICKDGVDSITSALKELENHGYLTRQRTRYGNGRLGDITYTIHERPVEQEAKKEPEGLSEQGEPEQEKPKRENPIQVNLRQAEPIQGNPAQLNTKELNTDGLNTDQSIYPADLEAAGRHDGIDRMDGENKTELVDAYHKIICENIEYSILAKRHGKQRMDETVELMLEVILSKRPYIRIAGDDFPREVVRSRFLKINSSHVEYVFDRIDNNTTKVGNIKAYLLTALSNAPATMDSYYRVEVNHDLYGT